MPGKKNTKQITESKWWKEAIVYQIYPRSFKDSNGDGIGDLNGIISKLDYIKGLGVDVVWLNPIYSSPNDDNGYDISDYRNIMTDFGTMQDFDKMLAEMHKRGIRLLMDLVVNHSSDEHRWFKESRKSRTNLYRDYYHWWPAEKGKPNYRYSFFDVNADAWKYDELTNAYYLHYFSQKQPDLNWENPALRNEIYDMMKFWFDKGVDGFRMDVIPFISKDISFSPIPKKYKNDFSKYYAQGPKLHVYLKEMNKKVLGKYDIMTVGECAGVEIKDALKFVDEDRKELNMFFHFEGMDIDRRKDNMYPDSEKWKLSEFKQIYSKWNEIFKTKGWGTAYLGNHDQSRIVSRFGNDKEPYRVPSAKMLCTFLLTQRATPYIYYGDEIGMSNIRFTDINDYKDILTINYYKHLQAQGKSTDAFLKGQQEISRDNGRTPMQWNTSKNAGFSKATPWLKVNPDYKFINVAAAQKDNLSILNFYKKMIRLRKTMPVLVYGQYKLLDKNNERVYAYTRTLNNTTLLILLNFSVDKANFKMPSNGDKHLKILINNFNKIEIQQTKIVLQPYQALVIKML